MLSVKIKEYSISNRPEIRWYVITALLILAGSLLRIYQLTSRSLWLDEALCVKIAAIENLSEMLGRVINDIHPPLFYILLHFWISLLGNTDISVRMFSVVWSAIGLFGIYFLCRYGLGLSQKASNLAMSFAIILPIHAYYSQEVRPYTMWFAVTCFALTFLFLANSKTKVRYYILFGIFQALMLYVHHCAIIYLFIVNLVYLSMLLIYRQVNRSRIKGLFFSGFVAVILYIPWLPYFFKQLQNPTLFSGFWYWAQQPSPMDMLKTLIKLIGIWKLDVPFLIPQYIYLASVFPLLVLLGLGALYAWRNKLIGESILCSTIVGYPLFVYCLSHLVLPIWLLRILIPAAIGVPIIAVLGTQFDVLTQRHNILLFSIIAMYILITFSVTFNLLHTYKKEDWKKTANFLSNSVEKGDAVLVYRGYYALPLSRYIRPDINVRQVDVLRESFHEDLSEKLAKEVLNLSRNSKKIYLILSNSDVPTNKLLSLVNEVYSLEERSSFYRVEVLVFLKRQYPKIVAYLIA